MSYSPADSIGLIDVSSLIAVSEGVHDYINNKLVDLLLKKADQVNVNKIIEYLYIVGTDASYSVGLIGIVEKDFNGSYSLTAINAIYDVPLQIYLINLANVLKNITSLGTLLSQCVPNND